MRLVSQYLKNYNITFTSCQRACFRKWLAAQGGSFGIPMGRIASPGMGTEEGSARLLGQRRGIGWGRSWREQSTWARGATLCRRWRSAIRRQGGSRRATAFPVPDDWLASQAGGPGRYGSASSQLRHLRKADALTAMWEASDRVCGSRLMAMIPILLPALEQ